MSSSNDQGARGIGNNLDFKGDRFFRSCGISTLMVKLGRDNCQILGHSNNGNNCHKNRKDKGRSLKQN
nr:hypothetical protein [Desulfamplus magnetovallimortis]